jgi:predicted small secreted protein
MGCVLRIVAAAGLAVVLAGCGTAAGAGRSLGSSQLVKDLASRLSQADSIGYTANFSVADHEAVSIAHAPDPARTAYRFPGGVVLVLPEATMSCAVVGSAAKCSRTDPLRPPTAASPTVDHAVEGAGMIRPEIVSAILNQTAMNGDAIIAETDRTLATTHATCVSVTGVPQDDQFQVCVTADGLLGQFTGTISGKYVDMELDRYQLTTDAAAFNPPSAAAR